LFLSFFRRERDRHRDKSDAKMESVKQEGAGEYNENRPPPSNQGTSHIVFVFSLLFVACKYESLTMSK